MGRETLTLSFATDFVLFVLFDHTGLIMKVSPTVLSVGLLPLAAAWAVSAAVFVNHGGGTSNERVPSPW